MTSFYCKVSERLLGAVHESLNERTKRYWEYNNRGGTMCGNVKRRDYGGLAENQQTSNHKINCKL